MMMKFSVSEWILANYRLMRKKKIWTSSVPLRCKGKFAASDAFQECHGGSVHPFLFEYFQNWAYIFCLIMILICKCHIDM